MTTYRLDGSDGPGTHVFIIGVGDYPYLRDGSRAGTAQNRKIGQLTSPPVSAMKMLQWVDGSLSNPQAPLKSIEVLISAVGGVSFTDSSGLSQQIDCANWENYEKAVTNWKVRASSHPQNVAVFYFCGHGMGDSINTYLLTEDAGRSPKLLRHGIHVGALRLAMGDCTATKQLYLIDACRSVDLATVLDPYDSSETGLPESNPLHIFQGENPVLFSARQGNEAFGVPGQASVFTKALLDGLNRCAVFRPDGRNWAVSPHQLQKAIAALMEDFSGSSHCPADGISGNGFQIHVLTEAPEVVLHVHLNDKVANDSAVISYTSAGNKVVRQGNAHPWRTFAPHGLCLVEASFNPAGRYTAESIEIYMIPPFQNITLEVL